MAEEDLAHTLAGALVQGTRRLNKATKTGAWLTLHLSMANGIELGVQEWRYSLLLQYGLDPPDLPHYCNVCNTTFSIFRALDCKWGGLVTARHNELRDRVADLAGKAFTPTHVRYNPLIFACCAVKRPKAKMARSKATKDTASTPPLEAT